MISERIQLDAVKHPQRLLPVHSRGEFEPATVEEKARQVLDGAREPCTLAAFRIARMLLALIVQHVVYAYLGDRLRQPFPADGFETELQGSFRKVPIDSVHHLL